MTARKISLESAKRIVGERVTGLRSDLGLSVAECARTAEVPESVLLDIERGEGEPDVYAVDRIASVLGCELDELAAGVRWVVPPEGRAAATTSSRNEPRADTTRAARHRAGPPVTKGGPGWMTLAGTAAGVSARPWRRRRRCGAPPG
jgi:transcriptional regulator with XRE-family HTH domain